MSESEEVAVDSFGRVILQKENSDSRRDHNDGDSDRRKRDRDGDVRDKDDRNIKLGYDHDKNDFNDSRDYRLSGGQSRMDGPDRSDRHDRGPDRGPDRGLDRGHPSHNQRGPPHNFNNRGGGSLGGGRGGYNDRDNRGPNGMPGGFRRDERDMHQLQGQGQGLGGMNNSRGYLTGRPPSPPPLPTGSRPTKHFETPHLPSVLMRIDPLKSFKNFMHGQADDLPPDQFQRRYEEYHLRYVKEFSETFFHGNKSQEWFKDRYDPLKMQEQEADNVAWALKESVALKKCLRESPATTITAMCLDPVKQSLKGLKRPQPPTTARPPSMSDSTPGPGSAVITAPKKEEERKDVLESAPSGAHLFGHEDRTIILTGIHACCTKGNLRAAVIDLLAAQDPQAPQGAPQPPIPLPERVLISQPVWGNKMPTNFERSAWIVMPSVQSARQALPLLKDMRVDILGPPNDIGKMEIRHQFRVQAHSHSPKQYQSMPDQFSSLVRVNVDTMRAMDLAALLDEDRTVAEENRLSAILDPAQSPMIAAAITKPTDKLDIAIAYLRRVHFVAFYGGRRYRDEAHLLAMAPSLTHRAYPCTPTQEELDALNTGNNVTGIKVLNNSIVTVENESMTTTKENGRSESITDQSLIITTVSDMSEEAVVDSKDRSKDENKERDSEGKIVVVGENVIEAVAESSEGVTSAMTTTDNVEEMGDNNASVEEGKEGGEGQGEGGDDDSNKKRKRSESCVDDTVTLPPTDKENIDDVPVTDANDTVLTSETENKAIESDSALVNVTKDEKDENRVEKSRVEVDKSKSNAIISAPIVRSFPVRQSALTDRRVDNMIQDIRMKLKQRAARTLDPSLRGTVDEEDCKILALRQEQRLQRWMEENCAMEAEGKARCCFQPCIKLFKTSDYLRKHLLTRHETFASELQLQDAEPFMRTRYESEDIASRPLPPIECEVAGGTERKSVREVLEKGKRASLPSAPPDLFVQGGQGFPFRDGRDLDRNRGSQMGGVVNRRRSEGYSHDRGGDRGNIAHRERDDRDRDRRNSGGSGLGGDRGSIRARDFPSPPTTAPSSTPGQGPIGRPSMSIYMDVDAPKEIPITIDYGVAFLPPAKKRKVVPKKVVVPTV